MFRTHDKEGKRNTERERERHRQGESVCQPFSLQYREVKVKQSEGKHSGESRSCTYLQLSQNYNTMLCKQKKE